MGVVLLLGGALLGGFLVRIFGADSGREKQLQQELEKTKKELTDYRGEVESHFRETAQAVNTMTESYRQVYDKLRVGATRLCGEGGQLLDLKPVPLLEETESKPATAQSEDDPIGADPEPESATASAANDASVSAGDADAEERPRAESQETPAAATADDGEEPAQDEPRAPLDYAAESDEEERDKTLH